MFKIRIGTLYFTRAEILDMPPHENLWLRPLLQYVRTHVLWMDCYMYPRMVALDTINFSSKTFLQLLKLCVNFFILQLDSNF